MKQKSFFQCQECGSVHYIETEYNIDGEMYEQYGGIYSYRQKINPILKRNGLNPIGHLEEWIDYD